ncbi:MAG: peptidase T [Planctomycetes bacterium]|nr:peptidase T [Planctomycetota bacterium]
MERDRLLQRFLRYVRIDTTADDATDRYPSCEGQWELGRLLVRELTDLGLSDVHQDEHGLVWATVPATVDRALPVVAFNAHLDTSPETSGKNVQPQVIRGYDGGDITLPGDPRRVIRVSENPELDSLHGSTLITTDGTTLLGGDDKAGIAVIVEAAATLMEQPQLAHGPIRLLFTCDEEIGRGVQYVDLEKLAADVCYTLDGDGAGKIDVETFSADLATVTIRGVNIHPSIAKGRMVNALRAAGLFLSRLPRDEMSPEVTDDRQGFVHPYQISGGVAEVLIKSLLRDFETENLAEQAAMLRAIAREVEQTVPGVKFDIKIAKQYRNLGDGLKQEPRAVEFAKEAFQRRGYRFQETIIRGGTDGSLLTEKGLPTPNLSTGQHNPHSPLEWACLEQMSQAVDVLVELVQVWAERC